ncbi:hypothetical protein FGB62_22g95 [Gracilaria domingensis]|nr:hypothetical protein FGB62_22g95 [Gracilaria domingensis]
MPGGGSSVGAQRLSQAQRAPALVAHLGRQRLEPARRGVCRDGRLGNGSVDGRRWRRREKIEHLEAHLERERWKGGNVIHDVSEVAHAGGAGVQVGERLVGALGAVPLSLRKLLETRVKTLLMESSVAAVAQKHGLGGPGGRAADATAAVQLVVALVLGGLRGGSALLTDGGERNEGNGGVGLDEEVVVHDELRAASGAAGGGAAMAWRAARESVAANARKGAARGGGGGGGGVGAGRQGGRGAAPKVCVMAPKRARRGAVQEHCAGGAAHARRTRRAAAAAPFAS